MGVIFFAGCCHCLFAPQQEEKDSVAVAVQLAKIPCGHPATL
jgi:hypothetical protein